MNFVKFLRTPLLMDLCEGMQIFSKENTSDGVLFSAVVGMRASGHRKRTLSQILYYEIFKILQNIIFAEHCCTTASNFHQQVGYIACLISNDSITISESPMYRRSYPQVFLGRGILKICCKFTGQHPCRSVNSIKFQINFIEIAFHHWCSTVNMLHIFFRTPFPKNTSGRLLLNVSVQAQLIV